MDEITEHWVTMWNYGIFSVIPGSFCTDQDFLFTKPRIYHPYPVRTLLNNIMFLL